MNECPRALSTHGRPATGGTASEQTAPGQGGGGFVRRARSTPAARLPHAQPRKEVRSDAARMPSKPHPSGARLRLGAAQLARSPL
eukprot:scaffold3429_cov339-Prasinococcus_capsulatus_cf.AAC.1